MDKLIIIALIVVGCNNINDKQFKNSNIDRPKIIYIDSCEYIEYTGTGGVPMITHRGRCKHCENRSRQLIYKTLMELRNG